MRTGRSTKRKQQEQRRHTAAYFADITYPKLGKRPLFSHHVLIPGVEHVHTKHSRNGVDDGDGKGGQGDNQRHGVLRVADAVQLDSQEVLGVINVLYRRVVA